MRYISGTLLTDKWPNITGCEREKIVETVADMLKQLQSLSIEKSCPIEGVAKSRGQFFIRYDAGPFDTVKDLENRLNSRLSVCTHMDGHSHNIIVDDKSHLWFIDCWGVQAAIRLISRVQTY